MRRLHQNMLVQRGAPDNTWRALCEAQAEQRSDVLKTKADLQSADTFVARTADFTAGNSLTAAAQTTAVTLASAPAANHLYETHFKVTINTVIPGAGTNTHKVVVAVETDPTGAAVWTEQFNYEYEIIKKVGETAGAIVWANERLPVRVTGFTSSGQIRLKIKSASGPGGWSFSVHGFNVATDGDPIQGVTYHTGPAIDFLDGVGATLADTVVSKISHGTTDSNETDLGGGPFARDEAPFIVARIVWGKDDSADLAIDRIKAFLNPCVDGVPGNKNVAWFVCQPYALSDSGVRGRAEGGTNTEFLSPQFVPLSDPVRTPAGDGTSAQDYTFTWHERSVVGPGHTIITLDRKPRPKSVRPNLRTPGGETHAVTEYDNSPTTFVFIWAIKADGTKATNVAWARNTAVTEVVNGSRKLRTVQIRRAFDQWIVEGPTALGATARPVFRMDVQCGSYANANLEFTGANLIDLGASPTETVEFAAVQSVPVGCQGVFEVRNDADSAWLEFKDGQTAAEVGVSQRQTYKVRWRGLTNTETDATPTLFEIGARDIKRVWLSDIIQTVRARFHIPDVAELIPAIPQFELTFIKNGEQDFRDRITTLLSENYIGSLAFRIWVGDEKRPRNEWHQKDDAVLLDDYDPGAANVSVLAHGPTVLLRGALPIFDTTTQKQSALRIANKTPTEAWNEIVGVQLAADVPARYRGDVTALGSSVLITKTITDSDGKTEADAIAHIAGCVIGSDAGKIRAFDMFMPGSIVAFIPTAKIEWASTAPGFRQRVPEVLARYDYRDEEQEYKGVTRVISANALLNLKPARIDANRDVRDEVCRWMPTEKLATDVAQRRVNTLGTGMLVWRFTSTEPYPELRFGDRIAVETDRFIARDPTQTTLRTLKGQLWAIGRVVEYDIEGRELAIWIQSYADILGSSSVSVRFGLTAPEIKTAKPIWRGNRLFIQWTGLSGVGSAKVNTSTSAYPAVGSGTTQAGSENIFDAGLFNFGDSIFVTITPYAEAAAAGREGIVYQFRARLGWVETMLDPVTGKPLKSTAWNDNGAFLTFVSPTNFFSYATGGPASAQMWISFGWTSQNLLLPDGSTKSVPAPPAAPSAPTLSQTPGGALGARTRWARIGYLVTDPATGHESVYTVSAEASFAISANNLLVITAPSDPGGGIYSGWCALVGSASNTEYVQGVTAKQTFGVNWTEPVGGFSTTQNSLWTTSWKNLTKIGIDPSTAYHHYPFYDIAKNFVYIPAETNAKNASLSIIQHGDGVLSLGRYDSGVGYSGDVTISTPAAASTSSGNAGGGRLM
jgi:hypothetical protein